MPLITSTGPPIAQCQHTLPITDNARRTISTAAHDDVPVLVAPYAVLMDLTIQARVLVVVQRAHPLRGELRRINHDVDLLRVVPRLRVLVPVARDDDLVVDAAEFHYRTPSAHAW